jgi:hypothetical protein
MYILRRLKTLQPGGIRTRDLMFWRWTRWPLCHATMAMNYFIWNLGSSPLESIWAARSNTARVKIGSFVCIIFNLFSMQLAKRDDCLCCRVPVVTSPPGLPDFSWCNVPKREEVYQMTTKYTKQLAHLLNRLKIYQITTKCTNLFHSKALQNIPTLGILVWKYTIWQPWSPHKESFLIVNVKKYFCHHSGKIFLQTFCLFWKKREITVFGLPRRPQGRGECGP